MLHTNALLGIVTLHLTQSMMHAQVHGHVHCLKQPLGCVMSPVVVLAEDKAGLAEEGAKD